MRVSRRPSALAAVMMARLVGHCLAVQPLPLVGGTYCGPGDAKIVIDSVNDTVSIDGVVCSFPIIAADHLQSELCSKPEGVSEERIFDMHVVGRSFYHDGHWYTLCSAPMKP